MIERADYIGLNPDYVKSLFNAKKSITTIDAGLRALVEVRISQLNCCFYCVHNHTAQARAANETQERLDAVVVWREAPCFDAREKAAFAWAETVTAVSENGAPQDQYDQLSLHFSEREIVDLTAIVALMNAWNRLAVSFSHMPD